MFFVLDICSRPSGFRGFANIQSQLSGYEHTMQCKQNRAMLRSSAFSVPSVGILACTAT